jgi:ribonuclease III
MEYSDAISGIEQSLGHAFRDRSLLELALTHSSFAHEYQQAHADTADEAGDTGHYERLEFLGDAVLALVISDLIMQRYPDSSEGDLSRIRAGLVCEERLAELARGLGLGQGLRLGKGEEATGGHDKPSILADIYEAVVAAVYLDAGFERARQVVIGHFKHIIESVSLLDLLGDYKTPLQELVQAKFKTTPHYRVVKDEGPDHMKTFEVELIIDGRSYVRGRGQSKKEAEQDAARKALLSGVFDE